MPEENNDDTTSPAFDQEQGQVQEPATIPPATPDAAPTPVPAPASRLVGMTYLGGAAIIGVPARDLTIADLAGLSISLEDLQKTGLYLPKYEEITPEIQ